MNTGAVVNRFFNLVKAVSDSGVQVNGTLVEVRHVKGEAT